MDLETKTQLDSIFAGYASNSANLIPILQAAQERFGYLPQEVMAGISRFLRLPTSTVYGVSTFYAQFKLTPTGRRTVKVCRGTACHVRGANQILRETEKELGIKAGETTTDLEYTLETVACIGACALAPTVVINTNVHGKMTTAKVRDIFNDSSKKA
ncbi:NADH-quinone oxidoreductase subunit NuoE [Chloroflexota bacterium]